MVYRERERERGREAASVSTGDRGGIASLRGGQRERGGEREREAASPSVGNRESKGGASSF